ncbi:MAG: S8 family serine peptidase, partial [Anaerolineae bacterium]|nr:S8 family serine peptidase [Anaerolineae bacterium]
MAETFIVYVDRRQRNKLAQQGITFRAVYDDYVLVDLSPQQATDLRTQGYEVLEQEMPTLLQIRGRTVAMVTAEEEGRTELEPRLRDVEVLRAGPSPDTYGPGRHYYLVNFIGPVKNEWLKEIEAHGGTIQDPVPPYAYIIGLDQAAYEWLTTEPSYVRFVGHFTPTLRLEAGVRDIPRREPTVGRGRICERAPAEPAAAPRVERVPNIYVVRFFEPDDLEQAIPHLQALGAAVGEYEPGATILTVSFPPETTDLGARVERIGQIHGVRLVEGHKLRQLRNSVAVRLMAAEEVISPSGSGLSGRGEVVGVADSGLDTGDPANIHSDFAGRVVAIRSWPVSSDWAAVVINVGGDDGPADTRSGHGTHVAGSICGNGAAALAANNGEIIRGLAAEAQLVFQAIEQTLQWTEAYKQDYYRRYGRYPPAYGLAGLPVDLTLLFQQAYDAGVRIHNNSWGGGDFGEYDTYAEAVDRFMWEHPDFLILFAAGNDGIDGNRDGVVESGSITPPATAKNCLTVGAAESVRTQGGYQAPYGRLWPGDYPALPLRDDRVSDHADDIAAFSSRGPTRDGRIKPDLVAPGTNIVSTRSQALDATVNGWGPYAPLPTKYMFDGGTSMATPLVAGAAALVRQYLRTVKGRRAPSAALIKATLIHAATYRPYRFEAAPAGAYFDMSQGWGHLNLAGVLLPPEPVQVRWYDNTQGLNTGESMRWSCTVADPSVPLMITIAWTDYPGSAGHYPNLVNDLDLVVTSPTGRVFYGNAAAGQAGGRPDRVNNVERVIIPAPEVGRYQIRIRAFNVPRGPQPFAL